MINVLSTIALVKLALIASTRRDLAALYRQQLQQAEHLGVSNQATLFLLDFNNLCMHPYFPASFHRLSVAGAKYLPNCNDQISTTRFFFVASSTGFKPVRLVKFEVAIPAQQGL